jgi:hypothetical protein
VWFSDYIKLLGKVFDDDKFPELTAHIKQTVALYHQWR